MYVYIYIYTHIHICIYIYIERERDIGGPRQEEREYGAEVELRRGQHAAQRVTLIVLV